MKLLIRSLVTVTPDAAARRTGAASASVISVV
jgi:hypothetical protein